MPGDTKAHLAFHSGPYDADLMVRVEKLARADEIKAIVTELQESYRTADAHLVYVINSFGVSPTHSKFFGTHATLLNAWNYFGEPITKDSALKRLGTVPPALLLTTERQGLPPLTYRRIYRERQPPLRELLERMHGRAIAYEIKLTELLLEPTIMKSLTDIVRLRLPSFDLTKFHRSVSALEDEGVMFTNAVAWSEVINEAFVAGLRHKRGIRVAPLLLELAEVIDHHFGPSSPERVERQRKLLTLFPLSLLALDFGYSMDPMKRRTDGDNRLDRVTEYFATGVGLTTGPARTAEFARNILADAPSQSEPCDPAMFAAAHTIVQRGLEPGGTSPEPL